MIKFISYHFLHLIQKKWLIFTLFICMLSLSIFIYLAGGFNNPVERVLYLKETLYYYDQESFLVLSILSGFWIIMTSKELFILEEPHVMLINKSKYVHSKMISYYLFYLMVGLILTIICQFIRIFYFGIRPINIYLIINFLLNLSLIHLMITFISGKNKNILFTIFLMLIFIILNGLYYISHDFITFFFLMIPYLNIERYTFGYLHVVLIQLLLYFLAYYKHFHDLA